jgi:hypothetical protein
MKKTLDHPPTCGKNSLRMERKDIERRLIETLHEVQELSGCARVEINLQTCPIYDLDGFDSLRGVESTVLLAVKLNKEFKTGKGEVNVFVSKDGRRVLKVEEIVNRLIELCN